MPRVLLDLTPLETPSTLRGIGRYVRGLVQGLTELGQAGWGELEIQGLTANPTLTSLLPPVVEMDRYCGQPPTPVVGAANLRRATLISWLGRRAASKADASLLHLTEPKGMALIGKPRLTITAHDLIVLTQRQDYLPPIWKWEQLYTQVARLRYAPAQRILAVSEATKRDLVAYLNLSPERIDVVWHGVDHERFHPQAAPDEAARVHGLLGSTAPYILYLGAGDARKDLDTLVRAHSQVARHGVNLVLAGHLDRPRQIELQKLAHRLGTSSQLVLTDYVAEDLVPALYRTALLHVFPSRYEGFGLPVLEALACGTPTVTSPGSSLDEVAGDAALIVPCGDPDVLAASLTRLVEDEALRRELRARGLARAATFTWSRCASETLAFWRRALA